MYSENSNTFVRLKPSPMNAAVSQQVPVISAPGLEDINSPADFRCFLVSVMYHCVGFHFSNSKKTISETYSEGQHSLKKEQGQAPKCQTPFFLIFWKRWITLSITQAVLSTWKNTCSQQTSATQCEKAYLWLDEAMLWAGPQTIRRSWCWGAPWETSGERVKRSSSDLTNSMAGKPQRLCNTWAGICRLLVWLGGLQCEWWCIGM